MNDSLTRLLGIGFPLLQAGMGGIAGPALAAAVAEAGAGGMLGLYRLPAAAVAERIRATRELTTQPFGVNLIPELQTPVALAAQVDAALRASDERLFFSFYGLPDAATAHTVRSAGRRQLVMVGDVDAVRRAVDLGADAVVLQGIEAGGHLLGDKPLDTLLRDSLAAFPAGCPVPLVAAGGIGHGRRLRQLHDRGAAGGLCGTLFVGTTESEAHPLYKQRLLDASADDTVVTTLFDTGWAGRRHRVLRNALTESTGPLPSRQFIAKVPALGQLHPLPRYSAMVPTMHTTGRIDEMAMYCGRSVADLTELLPAGQRVARFIVEFHAAALAAAGQPAEGHDAAG